MNTSNSPYFSKEESQKFDELLDRTFHETLNCWEATRINGASASMACNGNVSTSLLKSFDALAERIKSNP